MAFADAAGWTVGVKQLHDVPLADCALPAPSMTNGPRLVPELVQPVWTTRQGLLEIRVANVAGTLDLAGLDFIDSSGLHVILRAHHHSRLGRRLRLVKGKRAVQSVFQLTQTEDRLPFVE